MFYFIIIIILIYNLGGGGAPNWSGTWAPLWLNRALGLRPYKIQMCQPLKEEDIVWRRDFANHLVKEFKNGSIGVHKIWFSDETHFQLNGYLKKQNWRRWGTEYPHLSVVSPLHPQKITMWCAISSKRIIHPMFTDGMVIGMKCRELLEEDFDPEASCFNLTSRICPCRLVSSP